MKLGYTIVYVDDVKATVDFYERAFGVKRRFIAPTGEYGELDTGATTLSFASHDLIAQSLNMPHVRANRSAAPLGAEIGFIADDVHAAYAHAVANGAVSVLAPAQKPWGQTVSYVRDNNGFLVEICSAMT